MKRLIALLVLFIGLISYSSATVVAPMHQHQSFKTEITKKVDAKKISFKNLLSPKKDKAVVLGKYAMLGITLFLIGLLIVLLPSSVILIVGYTLIVMGVVFFVLNFVI